MTGRSGHKPAVALLLNVLKEVRDTGWWYEPCHPMPYETKNKYSFRGTSIPYKHDSRSQLHSVCLFSIRRDAHNPMNYFVVDTDRD